MKNFSEEELKEIYKGLDKEQLLKEAIAQARMQVERANIIEKDYVSKDKIREITRDIIIIPDFDNKNRRIYRPIKNTTKNECIEALYKIIIEVWGTNHTY